MRFKANYWRDRQAAWGFGNTVLYRMCIKDAPNHTDRGEVSSKCWLIGRSYSASPQRGSGTAKRGQSSSFWEHLAASGEWKRLDKHLARLTGINRFSEQSLSEILAVHAFLVELVAGQTAIRNLGDRSARNHISFASKYLHFHRPDHFPIFDSVVHGALCARYPNRRLRNGSDQYPTYGRFCRLILLYIAELQGRDWTLRSVDKDLYH
jgi:hypothetical protein